MIDTQMWSMYIYFCETVLLDSLPNSSRFKLVEQVADRFVTSDQGMLLYQIFLTGKGKS